MGRICEIFVKRATAAILSHLFPIYSIPNFSCRMYDLERMVIEITEFLFLFQQTGMMQCFVEIVSDFSDVSVHLEGCQRDMCDTAIWK